MATGRPVLVAASPAGQAAQLLQDAGGSVLVSPDDPQTLAAVTRWLITADRDVLAAFGALNHACSERHFDPQHIPAEQEQLILDTLPTPPSANKEPSAERR